MTGPAPVPAVFACPHDWRPWRAFGAVGFRREGQPEFPRPQWARSCRVCGLRLRVALGAGAGDPGPDGRCGACGWPRAYPARVHAWGPRDSAPAITRASIPSFVTI